MLSLAIEQLEVSMTKAVRLLLILGALTAVVWPQSVSVQGTLGGNEPMKLTQRPQFELLIGPLLIR